MLYIGFSTKTHKKFARIVCKYFRHCAPIIMYNDKYVLYQFVDRKNIIPIEIKPRDIQILVQHGWTFIKYNGKFDITIALKSKSMTCVQFTKNLCGIRNITIQTPDGLFKKLNKKPVGYGG